MIKIENLGTEFDEVTAGFHHEEIYVGLVDEMLNITEPIEIKKLKPDSVIDDLIVIKNNHTFIDGVNFTKVKAIQESVSLETTQIGTATKSPLQENKLTVQLLGSKAGLLGFKRWLKGKDLIVLAPEFGSNFKRQFGSKKQPCKLIEASSKIEPTKDGENVTTLVFRDSQKYDAPYYLGDLSGVVEFFKTDYETITSDRDDVSCDID